MNVRGTLRLGPCRQARVVSGRLCVDKNANKISIQPLDGSKSLDIAISHIQPLCPKPTSRTCSTLKLGLNEDGELIHKNNEIELHVELEDMHELYNELSDVLPKAKPPKKATTTTKNANFSKAVGMISSGSNQPIPCHPSSSTIRNLSRGNYNPIDDATPLGTKHSNNNNNNNNTRIRMNSNATQRTHLHDLVPLSKNNINNRKPVLFVDEIIANPRSQNHNYSQSYRKQTDKRTPEAIVEDMEDMEDMTQSYSGTSTSKHTTILTVKPSKATPTVDNFSRKIAPESSTANRSAYVHSQTYEKSKVVTIDDDNSSNIDNNTYKSYNSSYSFVLASNHRSLDNITNSCYMNATLQALASIPQFVYQLELCRKWHEEMNIQVPKLLNTLYVIMMKLTRVTALDKKASSYDSSEMRERLKEFKCDIGEEINDRFSSFSQQDAQELFSGLLDKLDQIAKKSAKNTESSIGESKIPCVNETEEVDCEMRGSGDMNLDDSLVDLTYVDEPIQSNMDDKIASKDDIKDNEKMKKRLEDSCPNLAAQFQFSIQKTIGCHICKQTRPKFESHNDIQIVINDEEERTMQECVENSLSTDDIDLACDHCQANESYLAHSFNTLPNSLIVVAKRYHFDNGSGKKRTSAIQVDAILKLSSLCSNDPVKLMERRNKKRMSQNLSTQEFVRKTSLSPLKCTKRKLFTELNNTRRSPPPSVQSCLDETTKEVRNDDRFSTKRKPSTQPEKHRQTWVDDDDEENETEVEKVTDSQKYGGGFTAEDEVVAAQSGGYKSYDDHDQPATTAAPSYGSNENNNEEESRSALKRKGQNSYSLSNRSVEKKTRMSTSSSQDVQEVKADMIQNEMPFNPVNEVWMKATSARLGLCLNGEDSGRWYKEKFGNKRMMKMDDLPISTRVEGDGNCLFRCICWWITQQEYEYGTVRTMIVDFVNNYQETFIPLLREFETMDDHIRKMRQDAEWGTQVELAAAATLLNTNIYTFTNNKWLKYKPLFKYIDGYEDNTDLYAADKYSSDEEGAIYISNSSGCHFDPVVSVVSKENWHDKDDKDMKKEIDIRVPLYTSNHDPTYRLVAVICHHGTQLTSGHYTCFSFDFREQKWLDCNDSSITEIKESQVIRRASSEGYMFIYNKEFSTD